jgi:hypothetical protein
MNIGSSAKPKYICDKCKNEIPYTYRKGIEVHKYAKWTNSCYTKDFDLCESCEKKFREWLDRIELPTARDLINKFPIYKED